MNKRSIIAVLVVFGTLLIAIFANGFYAPSSESSINPTSQNQTADPSQPTLISTSPSPLNNAIVVPGQKIILVFSHPLENIPELKYNFEPAIEGLQSTLSSDKKSITFSSEKPLPLGQEYTLTIQQEAKFEGGKHLDKQYDFHFKTIEYKGV